ncbi:hypothetical protein LCGC14_1510560 [marine sediment metagenome]|uniref:Uncharacterized protein n=1 Tax=marine sediment metagenome TaxID=412755 RepID=A0A0F9JM92_9ZZZZ
MVISECEEECTEINFCPYTDLYEEGEPCTTKKNWIIEKDWKKEL